MERLLVPIPEKGYHVPNKQGLRDEILTTVSAGDDTTGIANMVTLFHIVNNPAIQSRLLAELKTVMPTLTTHTPYLELEKLPYLVCAIASSIHPSIHSSPSLLSPTPNILLTNSLPHSPPSSKKASATPPLPHHAPRASSPRKASPCPTAASSPVAPASEWPSTTSTTTRPSSPTRADSTRIAGSDRPRRWPRSRNSWSRSRGGVARVWGLSEWPSVYASSY
jgi:Cytochrome P450